ncbi:hypothetical protein MG293_016711 [Ovis ammon polii]|uniref:Rho GTPase activating protein 27 n=1 Tax=Ovis ammon polii TaxID=230172 RepID=A0AAD4TW21_OVIAM|nr:hypothetical protein MG293_016711 [Ovis ammon polii]KAI4556488.1 hypothetical protein MJT46_015111 [Ovis ammon polii x Ovis aries]
MAADVEGDVYVLVEHPFEYTGKDGRRVAIQPNERYRLLRRSTEHWWHVRSEPGGRPFYLPAQYVRELPALGHPAPAPPPPAPLQGPAAPEPLAYDYRFVSASTPAAPDGGPAEPRGRAGSLCGRARPGAATQRRSLAPGSPACLYTRPAAPVRPAQSLDDLARTAAPPAGLLGSGGGFKACSVAGSWVCPRPLARSGSENVYEAIQDVRGPSKEQRPEQVDEPPEPVYANVERQPPATSPRASAAPRGVGESVWETHTDAGTGRPYYYNPDTGVTTWESPFEAAEGAASPATSPASVGSHESLETEWGQYWDEESRRVFFYNSLTGETAWEDEFEDQPEEEQEMQQSLSPSNQRPPTPETDYPDLLTSYPEEDYSPVGSFSEPGPASPFVTPPGWSCHVSPDGQTVYTNNITEEQWVRLENQHGKPYFYNPDDASVQWALPEVPVPLPAPRNSHKSNQNSETPAQATPPEEKRQPSKLSIPEFTVDLKGASLTWAPKDKSSKKNVLELRSRDGSEYLIQHDSEAIISTWHSAIIQGIQEMVGRAGGCQGWWGGGGQPLCRAAVSTVGGALHLGTGSSMTLVAPPTPGPGGLEGDISKVRQKLLKFLLRRPTLQSLREKGYIKDQVFGCPLAELCEREKSSVPRFVQQSIRAVEARGLDIDGLYRISGNLATIQKLRYKVDHGEARPLVLPQACRRLKKRADLFFLPPLPPRPPAADERLDLEDGHWEDVHVITGALKLFFRELPEPLFPFSHFRQFLAAIKLQDPAKRFRCVRDLVRSLPVPNHDTLRVLFQHLCRVIEHGERNRMSVQNVAIVFGPTLLRPETEEASMPMTMVFQNQVVELILQQCSDIFLPH